MKDNIEKELQGMNQAEKETLKELLISRDELILIVHELTDREGFVKAYERFKLAGEKENPSRNN